MKKIKLISIHYHNFKGIKDYTFTPDGQSIAVFGANATGKTTLFDGFTWLLFGKNSDEQKSFNVKPLDSAKKEILGLEPLVEAKLEINGVPVVLKRELSEVWSKPNGKLETERKPDKTKLYIDEVPKKVKEYQEYINSIVDEDTFKLLTNPFAFNNLHWTKRRDILSSIAGDVDQQAIIDSDSKLKGLDQILNGRTVDEQKKVIAEQKRKIKSEIDGVPARIDEANRAIPEIVGDEASLSDSLIKAQATLDGLESQKNELKNSDQTALLMQKRGGIQLDLQKEKSSFITGGAMLTQNLIKDINTQQQVVNQSEQTLYALDREIKALTDQVNVNQTKKDKLLQEYKYENSVSFDENSLTCPTCGQDLQAEKVADLKNNFNLKKSEKLESVKADGTAIKALIEDDLFKLDELKIDYESKMKDCDKSRDTLKQLKIELDSAEKRVGNFEDTEIFAKLSGEIQKINEQIDAGTSSKQDEIDQIDVKINSAKESISEINRQLSQFDLVKLQNDRIAELRDEEKQLKDKFNELDRQAYLIDEFIRAKVHLLESKINDRFKFVKFNLFDIQKNGNIDETCETTVNGVPYSTDLNNAAKINGGLDIINTLSKFYEVEAPIFIDNAESVNELITMNSQTVSLVVSQDKKLKVV